MKGSFIKGILGVLVGSSLPVSGAVSSGDLAIIGYYMDGSATAGPPTGDAFAWVALEEIQAGEILYFSDASYHGGAFLPENLLKLEVPALIPAGTVMVVDAGNLPTGYTSLPGTAYSSEASMGFTPSGSGDQLVIFQDPDPSNASGFRGLSAINAASTAWGATGNSQTESELYPGMTDGVNALAVGAGPGSSDEFDNVRYIGPTDGEISFLLEGIYDVGNWEGTDDSQENYVDWVNASGLAAFTFGADPFALAMAAAGLSGDDALPDATPFHDGVGNLLKFAFNMNLEGPDARMMLPGGQAGLPVFYFEVVEGESVWRLEYVRRREGGLTYEPVKSSTLAPGSFIPMTGVEMVEVIDAVWERVTIDEPYSPLTAPKMFGVVEVVLE